MLEALTTFVIALSSSFLIVTGTVLFVSPRGRVAHWSGWSVMKMGKEDWAAVHIMMAIVFVCAALVHLYLNWKPFTLYLKKKTVKGFHLKWEFAAACALVAVVFIGTLSNVVPFRTVLGANLAAKDYWEGRTAWLPYPHAEESTLDEFARKTGISREKIVEALKVQGITDISESATITQLAERHGTSPAALFEGIRPLAPGDAAGGGGKGQGRGGASGGFGLGRKTLTQVCDESGISFDEARAVLEGMGVEANGQATMRDLAAKASVNPHELMTALEAGTSP